MNPDGGFKHSSPRISANTTPRGSRRNQIRWENKNRSSTKNIIRFHGWTWNWYNLWFIIFESLHKMNLRTNKRRHNNADYSILDTCSKKNCDKREQIILALLRDHRRCFIGLISWEFMFERFYDRPLIPGSQHFYYLHHACHSLILSPLQFQVTFYQLASVKDGSTNRPIAGSKCELHTNIINSLPKDDTVYRK